jgi:hypothetical protein
MFSKTQAVIAEKISNPIRGNTLISIGALIFAVIALIVAAVRR